MPFQENPHQKRTYWLLILLGLYCLLPFLILSFYTYPQADDFGFAVRDSQTGFWEAQKNIYFKWSGRFFGTAILRTNPLVSDSFGSYAYYTLGIILGIAGTLVLLLRQVFKYYLSKLELTALSALVVMLYLVQLPSTAEGLYWVTGLLTYTLANVLFLFHLLFLWLISYCAKRGLKVISSVAAAISGALMIGSNEMALVYLMSTLLFILISSWINKSPIRFYLLAIFCFCLFISLAVVLAPGNFARMSSHTAAQQPMWSTAYAAVLTLTSLYRWSGLLLLASLLYVFAFGGRIKNAMGHVGIFKVSLPLLLLFVFGTLFFMHFVFTWSTGERPTPRLENVIYFYLLLSWFYTLQVTIIKYPDWFMLHKQPVFLKAVVTLLLLLAVFNLNNNVSTAYLDLLSGKAARYQEALQQRTTYLRESQCRICVVPPLPALPATIYFLDIQAHGNKELQWVNKDYAGYFGKEAIFLAEPNPPAQDNYATLEELGKKWRAVMSR